MISTRALPDRGANKLMGKRAGGPHMAEPLPVSPKISLVLADVDGTLVTHQKVLTTRAVAAVNALQASGIAFAITSGDRRAA